MKHFYLTILFSTLCVFGLYAQSKKDIRRFRIASVTEVVTEYKNNAPDTTYTHKIFRYDEDGEVILEQEFNKDGSLEYEIIRRYVKGNEVEEIENFPEGRKKKDPWYEKREREFNAAGDELEEREYNRDGELVKREVYSYDAMGNKVEKQVYKKGKPDGKTQYTLDKKGLRTAETQLDAEGNIEKTVAYSYEFW